MSGKKIDFQAVEELARSNQWIQVEKHLKSADRSFFLSNDVLNLATLARRAYRLSFASYLLKPFVLDPEHNLRNEVSPNLVAEYAVNQIMLGGRKQALLLLNKIPKDTKGVQFAWVTYYFSTHDYEKAIPFLESSIVMEGDDYKQKLAELNLCACYVSCGELQKAHEKLESLYEYFSKNNYPLLSANSLELLGQVALQQNQWSQAEKTLKKAQALMVGKNKLYSLFIEKWLLVCKIRNGRTQVSEIEAFIGNARKLGHFHSVREILLYWGLLREDLVLLEKLYFSTKEKAYRDLIKRKSGLTFNQAYCGWNGHYFQHQFQNCYPLLNSPKDDLHFSEKEFLALESLAEDMIAPRSVSSLFHSLYPGEYFDPEYSIAKSYKVLQRLSNKIENEGFPVRLKHSQGKYSLEVQEGFALRLTNPDVKTLKVEPEFLQLKTRFDNKAFTREEVMSLCHFSKSSALRWLQSQVKSGKILKIGQGPGSCYQIAS